MSVSTGISARRPGAAHVLGAQLAPKAVEVLHTAPAQGGGKKGERECVDSRWAPTISTATGNLSGNDLNTSLYPFVNLCS